MPPHPLLPWFRCPVGILLLSSLPTKHFQWQSKRQENGLYNCLYFFLNKRNIFMICHYGWTRAGGTQHYVMSEGRRQGGKGKQAHPHPFAHKDINLPLTFWVFQSSVAYTFMIGFSRDGHRPLQISQASINWLVQPERNNIQKAKMPEMSGGYGPAEKVRVERMETRCPTLRCMLIFTRLCLHPRHREAFSVWNQIKARAKMWPRGRRVLHPGFPSPAPAPHSLQRETARVSFWLRGRPGLDCSPKPQPPANR